MVQLLNSVMDSRQALTYIAAVMGARNQVTRQKLGVCNEKLAKDPWSVNEVKKGIF